MTELHLVYAVVGVCAVVLALFSRRLRELPLSEPLVGLVLGILAGPAALGLLELEPHLRDVVLLEGARLLLAGSVMAAALRFPVEDLRALLRPLLLLLLVAMPAMALLTGAVSLVLGLPLALAALLGAVLCPTDPVLAASVVTGEPARRDLPGRVRRLLTGESGANDGLALALVGVAVAAVLPDSSPGAVVGRVVWEVVGGVTIGVVVGLVAGLALRTASRHHDPEPGPELVFTLLVAITALGLARVAGTGGVLAVFVAGVAYNAFVDRDERGYQDEVDEAVNRYAVIPLFVVVGATLPWSGWAALGPTAVLFVLGVLLLRRLPVVLALARPLGLPRRDAVLTGWFGPIGVSAVFYLAHSVHEGVADERFFAAGTLVVAVSVVVFALTGSPGRRLYRRQTAPG